MEVMELLVQVLVFCVLMAPSAIHLVLLLLMGNVLLDTIVQLDSQLAHHHCMSAHVDRGVLQVLEAQQSVSLVSIKMNFNKTRARHVPNDSTAMQLLVEWRITIYSFVQRGTTALMGPVLLKNSLVQLVLSIT